MASDRILVKGAREHNLKNIDVEMPRNKLVVITGVSGSGKSSLAFDTIYAEGQRRYVESLSAYARQFLELMGKPDVDTIEGLSPAISIEQRAVSKNPRSTVATVTEVYDYLRLLFARVGRPFCYKCGREIKRQTVQQMVDQLMGLPDGARIIILSPIVRDRKGEYKKELDRLRRDGFVRVRVDGELFDLGDEIELDKKKKHTIEVFVDRLIIRPGKIERRLADSLEVALKLADGIVKVELAEEESEVIFSERFSCPRCGVSYPEISPRMFSFNSPYGACPECDGLGTKMYFDPERIVPDHGMSLRDGAILPWERMSPDYHFHLIESLARHYKFSLNTPFKKLPKKIRDLVLHGSGDESIKFTRENDLETYHSVRKPFEGVIPNLDRRFHETLSDMVRDELQKYMSIMPCPECQGARLRKEMLNVKVDSLSISEVTAMSIRDALAWVDGLGFSAREEQIAAKIVTELKNRLGFMNNVGLEYLTLDRSSATLSGGEGQRIRLATQIGTSLMGVLYILDEPSIGLHLRDHHRLLDNLKRLRDLGNTVIVVEHDESTILEADQVVDMGPGAGRLGGQVVAQGTPAEIKKSRQSLTGLYLSGKKEIPVPPRKKPSKSWVTIKGARHNNLKDIEARFPLGLFTCVTGVSGSGKSSLVIDTLYKALAQNFYRSRDLAGEHGGLSGINRLDRVIDIDQAPIGRTPRSNPATYTGVFTPIRELFAKLPESRLRGYKPGRYSFNVKGGRCEACEGGGMIKIEMHFLPDVFVKCDVCQGARYNRETLEIRYKGKNIAQVLDMTVNEAMEFLGNVPPVRTKLQTLIDVGLGYIKLGQSATTLSGGEAQRIKLSKELSKRSTGNTLYILDEPTTGMHFDDINKLLGVLRRLVEQGNTVIVIEHNPDVVKSADWILDLGPEGGDEGGHIVAQGSPEDIALVKESYTGDFLEHMLERHRRKEAAL